MTENVPPERAEGSVSHHSDEALNCFSSGQAGSASEDVGPGTESVNSFNGTGGEIVDSHTSVIVARGRLAEARRWFAHKGWDVLPQGRRGRRILKWGADHAWMASPDNPRRSVRRWCRRWAPWLKQAELEKLVTATERSNKRWNHDQCATVLEITIRDRESLRLRFIGASDDPNYETRLGIKRAKAAARARRFRAAHSTGKRGRRALNMSPEQKRAHSNAQAAERMRKLRALRKNPSRDIIDIGSVTEFSVTRPVSRMPTAIIPASAIDGIDFAKFGIIGIQVMRGTNVVQAWERAASLELRGAQQHRVMP